jgi:thiol-disulfide isomerase/thioredoxin
VTPTSAWTGLALAAAILYGPSSAFAQDDSGIRVGTPAPIVTVNDLEGNPVNFGQWLGKKAVLIQFWATWCPNCEELLPRLREAQKLVGDRVEFLAVNVTVNQTPDRVRRYLKDHDMPFRILYDDKGTSTRAYQAPATSFLVIVDARGRVTYTGVGGDQRFEPALRRAAGVNN